MIVSLKCPSMPLVSVSTEEVANPNPAVVRAEAAVAEPPRATHTIAAAAARPRCIRTVRAI